MARARCRKVQTVFAMMLYDRGMAEDGMTTADTIALGVVVEKRRIDHPWADEEWKAVAVIAGAPDRPDWTVLREGAEAVQYHAATLPLTVHRSDTEAYLYNLNAPHPSVFVIMRRNEEAADGAPFTVARLTASAYEAQDYLDSGEEDVARVDMPPDVGLWLEAFVAAHHHEQPFVKRKRDRVDVEEHKFGQEPLVELRERMRRASGGEGGRHGEG